MRKLTFGFMVPAEFEMEVSEEEYKVLKSHKERRGEAFAIMSRATRLAAYDMDVLKIAPFNMNRDDLLYIWDEDNNPLYEY